MMIKQTIVLLLTVLTLLTTCKSEKEKEIDVKSIKIEGVRLDSTKLWQTNIETTQGIKKMQQIMHSFSGKNNATSYASLKNELETEFTTIFQKCTMKGEAHNQLHNYLKPMMPIFEGLESTNLATCKANFKAMEKHLAGYANYFKS